MHAYRWRKSFVIGALLAGTALLPGCGTPPPPHEDALTVTYMELTPTSVTLTTELSGRTSAFMVSDVRPQVNGIVQQRLFTEGADVKAGEVLYQIDPSLYQATYDSAKASLAKAEANAVAARLLAERYRQVVQVNAVSKQEYDNAVASYGQARAEVAAAKAALETASINLAYTKVTAPVSGRIGLSSVTPGALVTQNQQSALATVQQLDPMYVDVTQSSTDLLKLKRAFESGELKSSGKGAMQATLKLEDGTPYTQRAEKKDPATGQAMKDAHGNVLYDHVPVVGQLKFSDVTVEQSTGVITIRAVFPNPDGTLLPGMYVRAVLEEGVNDNAILIPQKSVIRDSRSRPIAQVLTKNATIKDVEGIYNVQPRVLTIDRSYDNQWLVTGGLKPGELLLLEGVLKLKSGQPVKGTPDSSAAPAPAKNATSSATDGKSPAAKQ